MFYKVPNAPASITGNQAVDCNSNPQTFAYSVAASSGVSFTWTAPANTTIVSGQGTNTLKLQFNAGYSGGTLSVHGTNACGQGTAQTLAIACQSFSRMVQPALTAVAIAEMDVYPNPSTGLFTVKLNAPKAGSTTVTITNQLGAVIESRKVNAVVTGSSLSFDLHAQPAGVYLVKVMTDSDIHVARVVVSKK